jgi:hypothetical protein
MGIATLVALSVLGGLGVATAGETDAPKRPEGAIVLFDGPDARDVSRWQRARLNDEGYLLAGVTTKDKFGDAVIHLEFLIPAPPEGKRTSGNSGVYIQRRYEIQILNTPKGKPSKGGCAAIYQFKPADTNQAKPPGEWQSYDIFFRAPRWEGTKKVQNARITLFHNGVKVHNDVEVPNKTGHGQREGPEPGPLYLQHHGTPVAFRNVWILPVERDNDPRLRAPLDALDAQDPTRKAEAQ